MEFPDWVQVKVKTLYTCYYTADHTFEYSAGCTFRILGGGGWQAVSLRGGVTVLEKRKFWQGG